MNSFNSNGISYPLYDWQNDAIDKWKENNNRGIVQATTGSGKSRLAHALIVEHLTQPDAVVTVLVPQVSLLRQWADALDNILGFKVGRCGGGQKDISEKINVMVINTALKILPLKDYKNHLIIADECHRMAAPSFQRVFDITYQKSLGLSATPEREDTGLQILTNLIGDIIYEYGYEDALEAGVISDFKVCAVQIPLTPFEKKEHDTAHQTIVNLSRRLNARYGSRGNLIITCQRLLANGTADKDVGSFLVSIQKRKEILNTAFNRFKALDLLLHQHKQGKIMVFHESIDDISKLERKYNYLKPEVYHSKKTAKQRRLALESFSQQPQGLLLSCKALVEGVDIPDADVGIMVSGTRSVRSRIQTIGRLLRKGGTSQPVIYLFYIPETSDTKAITNLLDKGFPKDKLRFMKYYPDNQKIVDVKVDVERVFKKRNFKKYSGKKTCPKCERTFKGETGLNNHHCIPLENMSFDDFFLGFMSKE
jgi:superfamily II DNA or RNA helicase